VARVGNEMWVAGRQRRPEIAPPSSVNRAPLTVFQLQRSRKIKTDTVQSSRFCTFSLAFQSSGLRPCASLSAYNSFASVLAKENNTTYLLQNPFPVLLNFSGRRYGLVTATLAAAMWSKKEAHTPLSRRKRTKTSKFQRESFLVL